MSEQPNAGSEKPQSSLGMDENIAALLSYLFGWLTGLIFFLLEKKSSYVKFHAMQSIIVFGALTVASIVIAIVGFVLSFIPILGGILATLLNIALWLATIGAWILLMVQAYQGKRFKLPIAGDIAEKNSAV